MCKLDYWAGFLGRSWGRFLEFFFFFSGQIVHFYQSFLLVCSEKKQWPATENPEGKLCPAGRVRAFFVAYWAYPVLVKCSWNMCWPSSLMKWSIGVRNLLSECKCNHPTGQTDLGCRFVIHWREYTPIHRLVSGGGIPQQTIDLRWFKIYLNHPNFGFLHSLKVNLF